MHVYKPRATVYYSLMQTKKPTTVIAVRAPTDLVEQIRQVAKDRGITVNEMLRLDIQAKYYCGPVARKTVVDAQTSDADDFIPEEDE